MMACECRAVCLCPAGYASAGARGRWAEVTDRARNAAARLGLRPYVISFVHVRWTGRTRGDGVEELITRREILPAPVVQDMAGLTRMLSPQQIDEQGTVLIAKISGAYTEDQILCRPRTGSPLPANEAIAYEVALVGGEARRFVPVGGALANLKPGGGWSVTVTLQNTAGGRRR